MYKKIVILVLFLGVFTFNGTSSDADVIEDAINTEEASFDLSQNLPQEQTMISSEGEIFTLYLEAIPSVERVSNGKYKVSAKVAGAWSASFHISITNNKFTKASNYDYHAQTGTISHLKLTLNSTTKATLSFKRTIGLVSKNTGFYCYLSAGKLKTGVL